MEQAPSLARSLVIQRRVIGALLMREVLTRYGRNNIGFLWLFVEPMIFTVGITTLWSFTKPFHGNNLPITAFALTGYSTVLLWRNMPARCIRAIEPNLSLMYHRNVKVLDVFMARVILEGGGATISFIVLAIVFLSLGWIQEPENISEVMFGWFMTAWLGVSLGTLLGALSEQSETVEKLWFPIQYLLFPLSGAAFMVDALPPAAQHVVLLLPMVHGVEILREGWFGSHVIAHYNVPYMALWCLGLTLLALSQTRKIGRMVTPE
jgi:capsular polysaccharide transport system permease protein